MYGPSGIVRAAFAADPADGSLFMFINRRRDRLKVPWLDKGGFWLCYRLGDDLRCGPDMDKNQCRESVVAMLYDNPHRTNRDLARNDSDTLLAPLACCWNRVS